MDFADRVRGAVLGHAVGDALGVPVEGAPRWWLDENPVTDMTGGGYHGQAPGFFSDDTSLMLCLIEAMTPLPDLDRLARSFIDWLDRGYWTPQDRAFGIGATVYGAVNRLRQGAAPLEAGGAFEMSNGNGSLMRILPMALLRDVPDEELAPMAGDVSAVTHRHPRSQIACGLFALAGRRLLAGLEPKAALNQVAELAPELYAPYADELTHFDRALSPGLGELHRKEIASDGYVVHTLESALWCLLTHDDFASAVLGAVNLGADTDTTAAVTGGLAGLVYGRESIPPDWLDVLARRDDISRLVDKLLDRL